VKLRVCRYRHYLGAWAPSDRVRVAGRAPEESELAELGANDALTDGAALAKAPDRVFAALTVPTKVRKEVWDLEWDDDATLTPRDDDTFAAYGRRVAGFFRSVGFPIGDAAPMVRLVATKPGVNPARDDAQGRAVALVNVGESDCLLATTCSIGAVSLRVPAGEGCLVSASAVPYEVIVPEDAEFGLLLELV